MKVALIVTENYSAWNFRRGLLKASVKGGINTYLIAPSGEYDDSIKKLGVIHIPVQVKRTISPLRDLAFLYSLCKIFRAYKFDVVHNISIKPNIYGALAARIAGITYIVGSVTGLGNVYMDEMGPRFRLIRPFVTKLYSFALSLTTKVWFQNVDDAGFFVSSGMISRDKVVIIRGSGVNTSEFSVDSIDTKKTESLKKELGVNDSSVVVSMSARALKSKGVEDFIEASEIVSARFPNIKFILIGDAEEGNILSLSKEYLIGKQSKNFTWLGWRHDIRELLFISDIIVLPSRYREGMPKSLLEAMAMNKPIITTNVPGCRELIEDGKNGYLVSPKSPVAIANSLEKLIFDKATRERFGQYSRRMVLEFFDLDKINNKILEELYQWDKKSWKPEN